MTEVEAVARAGAAAPADKAGPPRRRTGLRILAAGASLALLGAAGWATEAGLLPLSSFAAPAAPSLQLSPLAGEQQRVCPGGLTVAGEQTTALGEPSYKGYAELAVTGDPEQLNIEGLAPGVPTAQQPSEPTATASGVPVLLRTSTAVGAGTGNLQAAQSVTVSAPGAAGFAAASCSTPAAEQWLVGGSTRTGWTTLLALVNPGDDTAIVRVDLFGTDGALPATGLDGIEVPARSQLLVSLAGLAPDQDGFAVHLRASGSLIAASLHESGLDGLTPLGVEFSTAALAATEQRFVAVPFTATAAEADEALFSSRGAVLRAFLPGAGSAPVTVTVLDSAGAVVLEPITAQLEAGRVTDLPLAGFPVGRYTVLLESAQPVLAAVRSSTVGTAIDLGWFAASPALDGTRLLAVPPGPSPRLYLSNTGDQFVDIDIEDAQGTVQRLRLVAGATTGVEITAGSYVLRGLRQVAVSIGYDGPGQMSSLSLRADQSAAAAVTVYR